jgi:radical SAM protein with 4Fe4S-binding SPASM domain
MYRCYFPWHSVSILWDGSVVPCCRDYNGVEIIGDLNNQSLEEIWNGEKMKNLRKELVSGRITNKLCNPCQEANWELCELGRHYPLFSLFKNKITNNKLT